MKIFRPGASAEQINAASPELSRARSRQQKPYALSFYQAMHFIQENRQALYFVNHQDRVSRFQFLCEPAGIPAEREKNRRVEQVIDLCLFERTADKRRLAGLPRPEKEMRLLGKESWKVE
jgi:hypothetical protein